MSRKKTKSVREKSGSSGSKESCPHCVSGAETFRYMKRNYLFDVDRAREIVADGRAPIELEPDDVHHSVDISRIYPEHLAHVNVSYPGIIAHIWYQQPDGEIVHGDLLIDGHHRAARCLELQQPFFVHLLTREESLRIMLKAPEIYSQPTLLGAGEPIAALS